MSFIAVKHILTSCVTLMFILGLPATAYTQTLTLSDSLVAYYPFNGNANDESGNGHNGTVTGATHAADRFGNPNSAYSFDDSNIDIGQGWNTPNGSISMWIYQTSSGGVQRFLSDRTGFDNYLSLFVNNSNKIGSRVQETNVYDLGQVLALETSKWYHVAFLWGSEGMNLYLDDVFYMIPIQKPALGQRILIC